MSMILKKALKDLWAIKSKTLLVLIALIIGIYGLSTIVYTYTISKRDLSDNYLQTNPASVILTGERITDEIMNKIRNLGYVSEAEIREWAIRRARSNNNYNWMPLHIFASSDFSGLEINTFTLEEGDLPGNGEVLIERDGLQYLDGNDLIVQGPDAGELKLNMSGSVHDPGLPPSHMDHILYGYVNMETFDKHFRADGTTRILVRFSGNPFDLEHIQKQTSRLIAFINQYEGEVKQYITPPPGEHPHQGQLESLLFLQFGLGGLAVLLSILLLINVVTSMMREQIPQIGIMKSMGASRSQLIVMYLGGIGVLSCLAIIIALPLGYQTALSYSHFIAAELNFDVINTEIPFVVNTLLVIISLGIPILTTLLPVRKACMVSVKNAIGRVYGVSNTGAKKNSRRYKFIPLWMRIAYQNTFRNRQRLILSVFTLMLGLALFSTGLNVASSLDKTFQNNMEMKKYDFSINLQTTYPEHLIMNNLQDVKEIEALEVWNMATASFADTMGLKSEAFTIMGREDHSQMLDFRIIKGALPRTTENALVVNPEFMGKYSHLAIGDSVRLFIGNKVSTWYIAAIIADIGAATAYTTKSVLQQNSAPNSLVSSLKIRARETRTSFDKTILDIEGQLQTDAIYTNKSLNQSEFLQILRDHIGVIMTFLLSMALLVLLVGGIGMINIMNINIMERKKEIGIMRAVGASKRSINRIILTEMFLFGTMSWCTGWLVSYPLSGFISDFFGRLILETELDFTTNPNGIYTTFLIMIAVLVMSSMLPLRHASRITVQNAINGSL